MEFRDRPRSELLLQETAWAHFDGIMTQRALTRLGAALAWCAFAFYQSSDLAWFGLPMVLGAATSLLHARRRLLLRLFESAGRRSATLRKTLEVAFPYPASPHAVELPGYLEGLGLLAIAVPTGWIPTLWGGATFDDDVLAASAIISVMIVACSFFTNLSGHPSYAMGTVSDGYRAAQAAAVVGSGLSVPMILWPPSDSGPLRVLVVIGSLASFLIVLGAAVHREKERGSYTATIDTVERTVLRDLRDSMHTGLKNPAQAMLVNIRSWERATRALEERTPVEDGPLQNARQRAHLAMLDVNQAASVVASRVSAYVEATQEAKTELTMSATEVAASVLRLYDTRTRKRLGQIVHEEIEPTQLAPIDNERMASVLNELLTNSILAKAASVEVRFGWAHMYVEGESVELSVRCTCGQDVGEGRPRAGTLSRLAERLESIRGTLDVERDGPGSHTTYARWPVDRVLRSH